MLNILLFHMYGNRSRPRRDDIIGSFKLKNMIHELSRLIAKIGIATAVSAFFPKSTCFRILIKNFHHPIRSRAFQFLEISLPKPVGALHKYESARKRR